MFNKNENLEPDYNDIALWILFISFFVIIIFYYLWN